MSAIRSYPSPSSFTCSPYRRSTRPLFPLILAARLQQNHRDNSNSLANASLTASPLLHQSSVLNDAFGTLETSHIRSFVWSADRAYDPRACYVLR